MGKRRGKQQRPQAVGSQGAVGRALILTGLCFLGLAVPFGLRELAVVRGWPSVEGEVVGSEILQHRTSHYPKVELQYAVDGKTYTSAYRWQVKLSREEVEAKLAR